MNQVWNIARKELSDGLRNRWLLAISLLFAVLAVGIAWLAPRPPGSWASPRSRRPSPVWPAWPPF